MLPFTREQFFDTFADYNADVWPVQVIAYLIGIGLISLLIRPSRLGSRIIPAGLAAMWIWTGVAYHGLYFSAINKAAFTFAGLFVLQGALLLYLGVSRTRLSFDVRGGFSPVLGLALIAYAMIVYPLIGLAGGHRLAAFLLGVPQDWLLLFSGATIAVILRRTPLSLTQLKATRAPLTKVSRRLDRSAHATDKYQATPRRSS